MIVYAWNPETTGLERTNITSLVNIGDTSISVKNADRFTYNAPILVGDMGYETTEVATINSTGKTSTSIPVTSALEFAHNADDPVYMLQYDTVEFYSSSTIDGSKTLLSSQTIDVDNKDKQTTYDDQTGTPNTYYWTKYKNSFTLQESDFSDYVLAAGPVQKSIGRVVASVASFIGDEGYNVLTVDDYLQLAQDVNDDLISQTARPYGFLRKTILIDRTADQPYIDNPSDYLKFYDLSYEGTVNGITTKRQLTPVTLRQFNRNYLSSNVYKSDFITQIALDEEAERILIKPTPVTTQVGAFKLRYYSDFAPMVNLSQVVQTPNSLIYRYKFLWNAYLKKSMKDTAFTTLAQEHEKLYGNEVVKMQRMIVRDVGSPRSFADSETVSSAAQYPRRRYTLGG